MKIYIKWMLFGAIAMLVTSCKLGKAYVRPDMTLPDQLAGAREGVDSVPADTFSLADMQWWEIYGDTTLQGLIRQALNQNKDLLAASAKIKELAVLRRVDLSKLAPQIDGKLYADKDAENYGGNHYKSSPELTAKFLLSWELDLWGILRWGAERSKAQLLQSMENKRALQVSLVAQVAQSYFELVALDNELFIVRQTLRAREEGVRLAKIRFEGGLTSETSYQQAQVELARTATLVPGLERSITMKENEIALLTGTFPRNIVRNRDNILRTDESASTMPLLALKDTTDLFGRAPETLPVGLSSALMERRPDVRAAERSLMAANAEVGVAFTNLFPRISLTAQYGLESDEIRNLLQSPAHFLSANLLQPIFAMGRNRAQLKAKKAAYEQSVYQYEKQVITAFKEVSDAIVSYNKSNEVFEARQKLERASFSNNKLANLQYLNGYINYLDVLDAQRGYFDAQVGLSNALRDRQLALVQLYKALGGGWE